MLWGLGKPYVAYLTLRRPFEDFWMLKNIISGFQIKTTILAKPCMTYPGCSQNASDGWPWVSSPQVSMLILVDWLNAIVGTLPGDWMVVWCHLPKPSAQGICTPWPLRYATEGGRVQCNDSPRLLLWGHSSITASSCLFPWALLKQTGKMEHPLPVLFMQIQEDVMW